MQCLGYLDDGTFWTGQPYCDGGPLPYYAAWITKKMTPVDLLQAVIILESTIFCLGILYFLSKAYRKERKEQSKEYMLGILLFGFLIYVNTITEFETAMITFFIFLGYYLLFYTDNQKREWYAGVSFACAMITKFSALIPIGLIGLWYLQEKKIIYYGERAIKVTTEWEKYGKGIIILLPTAMIYTLLKIKYQYFFVYLFLTQTHQQIALTTVQTIKTLFTLNLANTTSNLFALAAVLILCIWELVLEIKEKQLKPYTGIAVIGLVVSIFLIVKSFGIPEYFITEFRYWVPLQPFIILAILMLYHRFQGQKKKKQALYIALITTILVFPGAYYSPLTHQYSPINLITKYNQFTKEKYDFTTILNYGYSIIPPQKGKVLVEWGQPHYVDELYKAFSINIEREKIFSITNTMAPTHPDVWQFPRFEELLGNELLYNVNETKELTGAEKILVQEIESKKYSLIIFGPPNWFVTERLLKEVDQNALKEYCIVTVPSNVWLTKEGLHNTMFIFQNQEDCQQFMQELHTFYVTNFEKICNQDEFTANEIVDILKADAIDLQKYCSSGKDTMKIFKESTFIKGLEYGISVLLLCIIFYLAYNIFLHEDENEEKKAGELK